MQHIATLERDDGLKLLYTDPSLPIGDLVEVEYVRTVIGVALPDAEREGTRTGYGYACVLGERVFTATDPNIANESMYIVLDEIDSTVTGEMFDALIVKKDKYLVQQVFCTDKPLAIMEALRSLEGLTRYNKTMPTYERKMKWPSYVGDDCKAGVMYSAVHKNEERMLNDWLKVHAKDPDTQQPVLDGEGNPVYRLVCPLDLPTDKARQGVQREDATVCSALYLAVSNMESSRGTRRTWKPKEEHERKSVTGY